MLFSLAKMRCRLTQMSLRFVTALNEWTSDSVRTLVVEQNSCKLLIVFTAVGERFDRGTSVAILEKGDGTTKTRNAQPFYSKSRSLTSSLKGEAEGRSNEGNGKNLVLRCRGS